MSNRLNCLIIVAISLAAITGCQKNRVCAPNLCDPCELMPNNCGPSYMSANNDPCVDDWCEVVDSSLSPLVVSDYRQIHYLDMTLQDCTNLALRNSKVFRDLGGSIITSPRLIDGTFDPAITYTDPQFSEEAALSAFDANFSAAAFFQNNDQASNLTFQGNNGIFQQDFHDYQLQLQKLTASGSVLTLRNLYNYDNSNQTGQTLPHSWLTVFEGEVRQPLLQGAGVLFNRIAGPSRRSGVYGGVLIARTNTEISLSKFEAGVRDLISEVENAYWDLFFAYRNLEAVIDGRDKAYEILVATTEGKSREGTQAQAQAKEQYLRFESDVLVAMEGRPTFGTRNNNGMSGGTFLSNGGVRVTERRLRLICGLPINGGELIRNSDEPATTGIQFDWQHSVNEAFSNRPELVQQKWLIKQRELQLLASKNFLKPRLDLVGQYRFRGLGRNLTSDSNSFLEDLNNGTETSSAFADLYSGDFQEWQVGAEFSVPLGFRSAHLGVRNAELALSRERALLKEQKREIIFGLSNAMGEARRSFTSIKAAEEQYVAAREFQHVMRLEVERGRDRDIELEAQRRVVDAQIAYRQAQVEYMLALKNIHFEKGTYLSYCNVRLSESQTNPDAAVDASARTERRGRTISYVAERPIIAKQRVAAACPPANPWQPAGTTEQFETSPLPFDSPAPAAPSIMIEPINEELELESSPPAEPLELDDLQQIEDLQDTRVTPSGRSSFNFADVRAAQQDVDQTTLLVPTGTLSQPSPITLAEQVTPIPAYESENADSGRGVLLTAGQQSASKTSSRRKRRTTSRKPSATAQERRAKSSRRNQKGSGS